MLTATQHHVHVKRGALIGTWTRMVRNTTDFQTLKESVREKVRELQTIGYDRRNIWRTLECMREKTKMEIWREILREKTTFEEKLTQCNDGSQANQQNLSV